MAGMRSPRFVLVACVATFAACGSQSLDPNRAGQGGSGTGTGGVPGFGGSNTGGSTATGGSSGSTCEALAQQYQNAIGAAQFCDVGATGACSQSVPAALDLCGSCPVFVSDRSAPDAIRTAFDQAGCGAATTHTCGILDCPAASNNVCVPIDGGSKGYCSYVPGTGGTGGSSADGGTVTCGTLATEYATLLRAEQVCDPGASGQCGQAVVQSLSPCAGNCLTHVNDATGLNAIQTRWKQAGCANVLVLCPAIACVQPTMGYCGPSDAGPGTCTNAYEVLAQ